MKGRDKLAVNVSAHQIITETGRRPRIMAEAVSRGTGERACPGQKNHAGLEVLAVGSTRPAPTAGDSMLSPRDHDVGVLAFRTKRGADRGQ